MLRLLTLLLLPAVVAAFTASSQTIRFGTRLASTSPPDPERMRQILKEEVMNPDSMKASAEMMKKMKPENMEMILKEIESMPESERENLKSMGMDVDLMKQSLLLMKENPGMVKQTAEMMENMSPEELVEKSKQAQEALAGMSARTGSANAAVDAVVVEESKDEEDEEEEDDEEEDADDDETPPPSPEVLDAMFKAAELMSSPPDGGVTRQAFATLPPIALLIGRDDDFDLSRRQLNECWADGSMGATRVDRAGFERVWVEVQEYFDDDLMDEARDRSVKKASQKRSSSAAPAPQPAATSVPPPQVGAAVPPEVLQESIKKMSDDDIDTMLSEMADLPPEAEERMKAMGVSPAMMKKTAAMMRDNPLMRGAAKMMLKNMSPEQMQQASQQAQQQMSNMSETEMDNMLKDIGKKQGK